MTRQEAYEAMQQGNKITHWLFSKDEYLYMDEKGRMFSEEGYRFDKPAGWEARQGGNWEEGWDVYKGLIKVSETGTGMQTRTDGRLTMFHHVIFPKE